MQVLDCDTIYRKGSENMTADILSTYAVKDSHDIWVLVFGT